MTEIVTTRTFTVQADSGERHEVTEVVQYMLRDGRNVVPAGDGLFRIVATGELLTPH